MVGMRCVAIHTSPNRDGLTATLAKAVLRGVKANGGEIEVIPLNEHHIKPCIACDNGWGKCRDEGICILDDDFEDLRKRLIEADAVCFATPVYWHDLSESAKIFLDRLRRCEVFSGMQSFAGKKVIGITAAGGSGRGAARALYLLEEYLRRLGFDIFDLVSVTQLSKTHKIEMLEKVGELLVTSTKR
jgi:multimeric flavodoxin WrbA